MPANLDIYYPNGGTLANQMFIWDGSKPVLWDGSVTFSGSLPSTVAGNKTNNAAAPTNDNLGALTAIANASAPTWTEGRQVLLSTDLSGSLRVAATISTAGLATSAKQDTGNTSLASIDTKTPALGQALAAASVPVVLTALQLTALTPPAAITNYALETGGHLAAIDGKLLDVATALYVRHGMQGPVANRFTATHVPAINTQATATKSSAGAGNRNVCTGFTATLVAGTTANTIAAPIILSVIDGSSGGSTYLYRTYVNIPAVAGAQVSIIRSGLWLPGSQATALTIEFSAAGGTATYESVTMDGISVTE